MVKVTAPPPPQGGVSSGAGATAAASGAGATGSATTALLSMGQVVNAELIKSLGDNEGLLKIAGRLFRAVHPEGLKPGTVLPLRVVDVGPPLVLKLPDGLSGLLEKLVHPSSTSFATAASRLLVTLNNPASGLGSPETTALLSQLKVLLDLPQDPAQLAGALARFVKGSGIFTEALMARGQVADDLKVIILKLLPLLGTSEGEALREELSTLLSHINAYQARSVLEEHAIVPFYLLWGDDPLTGELELEGEGDGSGEGARGLTVRLNMPRLGLVEAALWYGSGSFSVTLRFEEKHLGWIEPQLGELDDALRARGLMKSATLRVEAHKKAAPAADTKHLLEIFA